MFVYSGQHSTSTLEKCEECGANIKQRTATMKTPYSYGLSGLSGIRLSGILVCRCSRCKSEYPIIPRIVELHSVIAEHLIGKPELLKGEEIRFLRKNAGFAQNEFAALLKETASHFNRIERGTTTHLSPAADKLARAIVTAAKDGERARRLLVALAEQEIEKRRRSMPRFNLAKNRWQLVA